MPIWGHAGKSMEVVATMDHKKKCFPKAFETMVLLPEADTVMERVVVVFFKGVFLTSPFLA